MKSISLESLDIVSCSLVKYITIFLQSRTLLNATYSCPWLKGGEVMLRSILNSVWDWLLLYVMAYARCNRNCNLVSWYDSPYGNQNLNEMCGILTFCSAQSPTVKIVVLSCCHVVVLSCCHVVMLLCCHVVMLSDVHTWSTYLLSILLENHMWELHLQYIPYLP